MIMKAKELAKKLKVSPATISLVLNRKPGISDHLRNSLIQQIKELGCEEMLLAHEPDDQAQVLSSRLGIVYLIYTQTEGSYEKSAFYPAILEGAELEARENDYNFFVFHVGPQSGTVKALHPSVHAIGAVVQTQQITAQLLQELETLKIPIVFVDAYRPDLPASCVCVNNSQGVYTAVHHLYEMGHRNIGYISSGKDTDMALDRRRFFSLALADHQLPDCPEQYFTALADSAETVSDLSKQFRAHPPTVTAFMAENDIVAWQTIQALQSEGYKIPADYSVVGFDDRSVCTMTEPTLTTIKNFPHLMGRQAVSMIRSKMRLKAFKMEHLPLKYELPTQLVIRNSVRPLEPAESSPSDQDS